VGTLRIVLECHTCFDWLMPIMDAFSQALVGSGARSGIGLSPQPARIARRQQDRSRDRIGKQAAAGHRLSPAVRFEVLAVLPTDQPAAGERFLGAGDFAKETLITYPVPEERIDLIRRVLQPAEVRPRRRTTELTVAILQLVASRRGVAALPNWGIRTTWITDT